MLCCLCHYQLAAPGTPQPPRLQPYLQTGHPPLHIAERLVTPAPGLNRALFTGDPRREQRRAGWLPPFHLSECDMRPRFGTPHRPSLTVCPGNPHPGMKGPSCSAECGQLGARLRGAFHVAASRRSPRSRLHLNSQVAGNLIGRYIGSLGGGPIVVHPCFLKSKCK